MTKNCYGDLLVCLYYFAFFFNVAWFSVFQSEIYLSFSSFAVGGVCPASLVDEKIVRDYRKTESQNMNDEILEEYLSICHGEGVNLSNILNKSSLHKKNKLIYIVFFKIITLERYKAIHKKFHTSHGVNLLIVVSNVLLMVNLGKNYLVKICQLNYL